MNVFFKETSMKRIFMKEKFFVLLVLISIQLICIKAVRADSGPRFLTVGIYQNKPLLFMDEQGKAGGFYIDIIEHIARKEGWKIKYSLGSFRDMLMKLEKGEIDVAMAVAYSRERATKYLFSEETVLSNWGVIYDRDDSDISSILDLEGKTIAVVKEDIYYHAMSELLSRFNLKCRFIEVDDYDPVFKAIHHKEADAGIVSRIYGRDHENHYDVVRSDIIFSPISLRFAFNGQGRFLDVMQSIDSNLAGLKKNKDSIYYRTMDKWLGLPVKGLDHKWFLWVLLPLTGLLFLLFAVSALLRFQVRSKTEDLLLKTKTLENEIAVRKKTEKRLRQSEQKFQLLTENVEDVFWMRTPGLDETIYVSPAYEKVWGRSCESLYRSPRSFLEAVHPEDAGRLAAGIAAHTSGIWDYEYRIAKPDGKVTWIHDRGFPVLDETGGLSLMCGVAIDITGKKRSEKAIDDAHGRLLTVLDSIDAHIYAADMNTYEILFMNRGMQESFGSDLTGKMCYEAFRNESSPCSNCTNPKLVDAAGNPADLMVWEGENPVTGKWYINYDRAVYWVDDRIVRLEVATDITKFKTMEAERVGVEKQLRQSQKMEAIGLLAGGIAHDFNNILSAIIGYTELAKIQAAKDSVVQATLSEVLRAGDRAASLAKHILTFSRQSEQKLQPIYIHPVVKEALRLLRATIPATIEIRQNTHACSPVMADATQIHQILMNLCTNAYHAMENEGGILTVNLSEVRIEPADTLLSPDLKAGTYLQLVVSDTGIGMDSVVMGRIFDPYFTTKEKDKGTGLGLSVVHGIVQAHDGAIRVYSEPGKGTVFKIYLPAILQADKKVDPIAGEPLQTGSEQILFVDDEPALVEIGKGLLEQLGYKVTTRTSCIEALELVKSDQNRFDLVISDVTMPHMTGDQLAAELLRIRPDISIILCTGYSERINRDSCLDLGIKDLIQKPLLAVDLSKAVRKALDKGADER